MRVCKKCLIEKPLSEFYHNKRFNRPEYTCKRCIIIRHKKYRIAIQENRKKLKTAAKAVEMFIGNNGLISLSEIAEKLDSTPQFVSRSIHRYIEKPSSNLTLKSKV